MSCWPKQLGGPGRHGWHGRNADHQPTPDPGIPCGIRRMRTRNLRYLLGWCLLASDLGPLKTSQHMCACGFCSSFINVRALGGGSAKIVGLVHPSCAVWCWCCCWYRERRQNAENHLDKNDKEASYSQDIFPLGPSYGMLFWFFALWAFIDTWIICDYI